MYNVPVCSHDVRKALRGEAGAYLGVPGVVLVLLSWRGQEQRGSQPQLEAARPGRDRETTPVIGDTAEHQNKIRTALEQIAKKIEKKKKRTNEVSIQTPHPQSNHYNTQSNHITSSHQITSLQHPIISHHITTPNQITSLQTIKPHHHISEPHSKLLSLFSDSKTRFCSATQSFCDESLKFIW
jgi:hypothetical protein